MKNSKHIAGLVGPTLIVLTLSERLNSHIWATVPATQTYLAGALWFVAGLSILRVHYVWAWSWTAFINIIGYIALLGGLGRMFFPEPVQQGSGNDSVVFGLQIALLCVGVLLSYKAFSKEKNEKTPL